MTFVHEGTRAYDEVGGVGIAVKDYDGQKHVAILYRDDSDNTKFCHLAWHHMLWNREADRDYHWKACQCFDTEEDELIARGRLISIRESTVMPYGFADDLDCFTGGVEVPIRPIGWGLTCASFVLAVFEYLGYRFIDYRTWVRRPSDAAWQASVIERIRERDERQANALGVHIGASRYRPQEVAAAATSKVRSVSFYYAVSRATEVDDDLEVGPEPAQGGDGRLPA